MAKLTFKKDNATNAWVCEIKGVTGAFALNVVLAKNSYLDVKVKDPEAPEYANIRKNGNNNDKAYYEQFGGEIWPLDVKVICGAQPTFAKMIYA